MKIQTFIYDLNSFLAVCYLGTLNSKTRRPTEIICSTACQKLKFSFLLLEYCNIRECYAVANAFTIRNMYSLFLYMKCNSRKINRPTKNMTKIVTLVHFFLKLFLTKMQVKFSIFFHHGSLNVIGDKFRFVRSKLKSR